MPGHEGWIAALTFFPLARPVRAGHGLVRRTSCALLLCAGLAAPSPGAAAEAMLHLFSVGVDQFPCVLTGEAQGGVPQQLGDTLWVDGLFSGMAWTGIWPAGVEGSSPLFGALTVTCWDMPSPMVVKPALRHVLRLPRESPLWLARDAETGEVRRRWPQSGTETVMIIRRWVGMPHVFSLVAMHGLHPIEGAGLQRRYIYLEGESMDIPFVPTQDNS